MLGRFFRSGSKGGIDMSRLYDSKTFYRALEKDIQLCQNEAIIESPFITVRRLNSLMPHLSRAKARGVNIIINTKHPQEHENYLQLEAERCLLMLQNAGIEVLFTGGHHRKIAIFDRQILWEGSLNIFSQNDSCEIMRRIDSRQLAEQMIGFIKITHYLK